MCESLNSCSSSGGSGLINLQRLGLACNRIQDEGLDALCLSLVKGCCPGLLHLDVSINEVRGHS